MNLKKHSFAVITGLLFLVAIGGVAYLLFSSRGKFVEAKQKLSTAEDQFKTLSNGTPYPSDDNVEIEKENLEKVTVFHAALQEYLRAGQFQPESMERAEFPERLELMYRKLSDAATNRSIRLPADFYFGFEAYVDRLPEEEDVPRLTIQAQVVETLCQLLFSNKVASIESIDREIFERLAAAGGGARTGRAGGRGGFSDFNPFDMQVPEVGVVVEEESDLFTKEHVEILFSAHDENVWNVLDALGSSRLFTVVTSVEIESPGMGEGNLSISGDGPRASGRGGFSQGRGRATGFMSDFGESMGGPRGSRTRAPFRGFSGGATETTGEPKAIILPQEERLVAGREERATVQLGLDVYRFRVEAEEAPIEGEEGSNEATL